jgi:cephalosporin-C deacetylase-like acetyl esterase
MSMTRIHRVFIVTIVTLCAGAGARAAEDLRVFNRWIEWSNGGAMLLQHLNAEAFRYLDERDRVIAGLESADDWTQRQQQVRQTLMDLVGPFPERTPLNPRVTGVITKEDYRVEKIVFEAMAQYPVTAALFIPNNLTEKRPAILNVIGHSTASFRREIYQVVILNLVKKGFIVLAMDPYGQGERIDYWDTEKGQSTVGGSTGIHSYVGNQMFLTGVSPGRYFVWDGIRAIDYLLTRKEVDPERIGLTGLSGGGTQTSYISIFDDRVKAAAPSCYITGFRRLLESIGPQDAEQNFYHAIARGLTHADFLEVRAPRPTLIVATTRDFFSIQGARETYAEVKRAYTALGHEDHLSLSEDDYEHGFTVKNREATYAFFQRFLELPGDATDETVEPLSEDELNATPTGQLATSFKGRTLFDVHKIRADQLRADLETSRRQPQRHLQQVQSKARTLSGFRAPQRASEVVFRGRYQREGYTIECLALAGEGDTVIPTLAFVPEGHGPHPAVIWLHGDGKDADAAPGAAIEQWVRRGRIVLAPDVLGVGESRNTVVDYPFAAHYEAILLGRSLPGVNAGGIVRVLKYAQQRDDVDDQDIIALARETLCPALLHAAAFESGIGGIILEKPLLSYHLLAAHRFYDYDMHVTVAGALTAYDLPDLMACCAPRRLVVIDPVDHLGEPATAALIEEQYRFPSEVYRARKASDNMLQVGSLDEAIGRF